VTALAITEAEWQQQVIDLAHILGWRHNHTRRTVGRGHRWTTATSCKGWPDLTLWSETQQRVVFVELKSEGGRLGYDQELVLESLRRAGCEVHIWKPGDLEQARAVLQGSAS
jgi:hypothetical protein